MIHRIPIKCDTCKNNIILRISIGHEYIQKHTVLCPKCLEEINISLELYPEKLRIDVKELNNATKLNSEPSDAIPLNVSPNLPVKTDLVHKDYISPDMMELMKLLENNGTTEKLKKIFPNGGAIDMTLLSGKKDDILSKWAMIKKCWSLYKNNKLELLDKHIANKEDYKNPITKQKDFKFLLFPFLANFYKEDEFAKIMDYSNRAREQFPEEFLKFLEFVSDELFDNCIKGFYSVFLKFFDNYSEFGQVEIPALNNLETDDNYNVTSYDFYKTDMFYGTAYEQFTNHIDILALLFNTHEGRGFKQFVSMDYDKEYKNLDKANKSNPFKDIPELYSVCEVLYSGLRNASHHGDIDFDTNTHIVKYKHGKGKVKTDEMTYTCYLRNCYDLFVSCCILINVIIMHKYIYEVLINNQIKRK